MTTVHVHLTRPDGVAGSNAPARGTVSWTPTRRREVGTEVVVPSEFAFDLVDGEWTGDIDATGSDWCWQVREVLNPRNGRTWFAAVPDSPGTVQYVDLIEVDPTTLDPIEEPGALWTAALDTEAASRAAGDAGLQDQIDALATDGGAVDSVNGHIGVVVLAAADVGADAAGAASTAQSAAIAAAATALAAHIIATDPHGDRAYTDTKIAALVNGAPGILDTLGEIAAQLATDESAVGALTTVVNARLVAANNLSDLPNAGTARTNLGLGTAATHAHTDYDAAGAATAAQAAATAAAATDATTKANAAQAAATSAAATDATTKANAAQAYAIDRAHHTGTQTSATISDFAEAAQDAVAAALAGTTGATVTYDDAANTITITGIGDPETMRDTIGAALVGVGNITVTVDDPGDTITISTTATVNSTDAALRDRSTHTGSQTASTISDFSAAADARVAAAVGVSVQPLDSDLTAIAALTTTSYGRAFLALANQAALVALLPSYQPSDSDLTAIAALATTTYGRALLTMNDAAATKTALALVKADVGLTNVADLSASGLAADAAFTGTYAKLLARTTKTANYTAALWDMVAADTTGGTFALTLPAASAGKGRIVLKWVAGTTGPSVALTGTDHINSSSGPTTGSFTVLNQGYVFESDGSGVWTVTADDLPLSVLDARFAALAFARTSAQQVRSGFAVGTPGGTTQNATNGNLYLRPIRIGKGGTVTTVRVNVTTLGASSVIRLGLYAHDATTGLPTTLIADWGTVASDTTGIKSITISQALADDTTYWLAIAGQGGTPAVTAGNSPDPLLPVTTNANGISASLFASGVSGALPGTAPGGLATTISMPTISLIAP